MLKDKIESALIAALKVKDELRLSTLRMLAAAIHNRELEKRAKSGQAKEVTLSDEEIVQVVRAELKKRKDASAAYTRGGRPEAAGREDREAVLLSPFLPAELSDEELEKVVLEGTALLNISSSKEFGKLVGWVMGRIRGQASGDRVSEIIKRHLSTP